MHYELEIKHKKEKPFETDDGDMMDYCWYRGVTSDGLTVPFGSTNMRMDVGETYELFLEKTEAIDKKGKPVFRYKDRTMVEE